VAPPKEAVCLEVFFVVSSGSRIVARRVLPDAGPIVVIGVSDE
jgi:hypothetical protein